jgi:hypothetical protein
MIAHDAFSSLVNLSDSILVARHLVDEEFLAFLVSFTAVSPYNYMSCLRRYLLNYYTVLFSLVILSSSPSYHPFLVESNITDAYGNLVITSRHAPVKYHLPPIPHPVAFQLDHPHHLHPRYFFHGLDWQLGLVVK